jgi:hypothetical protein
MQLNSAMKLHRSARFKTARNSSTWYHMHSFKNIKYIIESKQELLSTAASRDIFWNWTAFDCAVIDWSEYYSMNLHSATLQRYCARRADACLKVEYFPAYFWKQKKGAERRPGILPDCLFIPMQCFTIFEPAENLTTFRPVSRRFISKI